MSIFVSFLVWIFKGAGYYCCDSADSCADFCIFLFCQCILSTSSQNSACSFRYLSLSVSALSQKYLIPFGSLHIFCQSSPTFFMMSSAPNSEYCSTIFGLVSFTKIMQALRHFLGLCRLSLLPSRVLSCLSYLSLSILFVSL